MCAQNPEKRMDKGLHHSHPPRGVVSHFPSFSSEYTLPIAKKTLEKKKRYFIKLWILLGNPSIKQSILRFSILTREQPFPFFMFSYPLLYLSHPTFLIRKFQGLCSPEASQGPIHIRLTLQICWKAFPLCRFSYRCFSLFPIICYWR